MRTIYEKDRSLILKKEPRNWHEWPIYWAHQINIAIKSLKVSARTKKKQDKSKQHGIFVRQLAKTAIAQLCSHHESLPSPPENQDSRFLLKALTDQLTWFVTVDRKINERKQVSQLPILNETDKLVAKYITKYPGQIGDQIALGMKQKPNFDTTIGSSSIRKIISRKLLPRGFYNHHNGDGYFPPIENT